MSSKFKKEKKQFNKSLGNKIEYFRKMRGMTLDDLSIQIGYTSSYISYIEKGNNTPSVFVVKKISDALNIPIEKLFNDIKKEDINLEVKTDPLLEKEDFQEYFNLSKKLYKLDIDINKFKNMIKLIKN